MDYEKAWIMLKEDVEFAVSEGYERGFNNPENEEYGKFYAYQRVLDKMKRLENDKDF